MYSVVQVTVTNSRATRRYVQTSSAQLVNPYPSAVSTKLLSLALAPSIRACYFPIIRHTMFVTAWPLIRLALQIMVRLFSLSCQREVEQWYFMNTSLELCCLWYRNGCTVDSRYVKVCMEDWFFILALIIGKVRARCRVNVVLRHTCVCACTTFAWYTLGRIMCMATQSSLWCNG